MKREVLISVFILLAVLVIGIFYVVSFTEKKINLGPKKIGVQEKVTEEPEIISSDHPEVDYLTDLIQNPNSRL